jgi:Domain of unknown function (DUF3472)/Domain of unknown function (DUF5077)
MRLIVALLVLGFFATTAIADEKLKGIACRSVHLGYPAPGGTAMTLEMTVKKSAPGSYFMACGWDKGYFGIQEQGNGKKVVIFSVWDSAQDNPKAVPEEKRVKVLHKDDAVRIGRFGGEGSGGQSFHDFDWKLDTPYRFQVTSKPDGERTEYAGFFYKPETKTWTHLVTFSTITGGKNLSGYYSFVEDFKRDKVSTTKTRQAEFANGWVKPLTGDWVPLSKARFTGDANPVTNIDAGKAGSGYYLATGGDIAITGPKLREVIELPAPKDKSPIDLP